MDFSGEGDSWGRVLVKAKVKQQQLSNDSMLKILLVLLPLAASAACGHSDLSACKKCGVGAIGMQFDGSKPNPYCT